MYIFHLFIFYKREREKKREIKIRLDWWCWWNYSNKFQIFLFWILCIQIPILLWKYFFPSFMLAFLLFAYIKQKICSKLIFSFKLGIQIGKHKLFFFPFYTIRRTMAIYKQKRYIYNYKQKKTTKAYKKRILLALIIRFIFLCLYFFIV